MTFIWAMVVWSIFDFHVWYDSRHTEGFGTTHAVMCVKTELLLFSIHSLVIPFPNFFANFCS